MLKKNILTISLILVFFLQTPIINSNLQVIAASNSSSENKSFWEEILSFLFPKLSANKRESIQNKVGSSENTSKNFTDYTNTEKDWTSRVLSASMKKKLIGTWFYDVLTRPNDYPSDHIIAKSSDKCPEIKISDLIYFFYFKNEKVIYDPNTSKFLDYTDELKNLISQYKVYLLAEECYRNAYQNMPGVPKGPFQGQDNAADLPSTQFNNLMRYVISQDKQRDSVPKTNITSEEIEEITNDSYNEEKDVRASQIPQHIIDQIDCSGSNEEIMSEFRKIFKKVLSPQIFLGKIKENKTQIKKTNENGENGTSCTISSSGYGMSQYGAEGMALSGKTYDEILTSYYGIKSNGIDYGSVTSKNDKITVKLTYNYDTSNSCDELINEYPDRFKYGENENQSSTFILNVEDYVNGLTSMPLDWSLEAHKSQSIILRSLAYYKTNNLSTSITDNDSDLTFFCDTLLKNLSDDNNQIKATTATSGTVLTQNGNFYETQYSICLGQASKTSPYFDGVEYEKSAGAPIKTTTYGNCYNFVMSNL